MTLAFDSRLNHVIISVVDGEFNKKSFKFLKSPDLLAYHPIIAEIMPIFPASSFLVELLQIFLHNLFSAAKKRKGKNHIRMN